MGVPSDAFGFSAMPRPETSRLEMFPNNSWNTGNGGAPPRLRGFLLFFFGGQLVESWKQLDSDFTLENQETYGIKELLRLAQQNPCDCEKFILPLGRIAKKSPRHVMI